MDLTMFKYHDECGRIGFTEDMYEKKDEIYSQLDHRSKFRFNGFIRFIESKKEDLDDFSKVVYYKSSKKVTICCKKHGDYEISPNSYTSNHRCKICSNNQLTEFEFLQKINEKFPHVKVLSKFIDLSTSIEIECTNCGKKRKIIPHKLLNLTFGCRCLGGNEKYTTEEYKSIAKEHNLICLESYINNSTPILHECLECGYKWKVRPSHIISNQSNCPQCSLKRECEKRKLSLDEVNNRLLKNERPLICLIYTSGNKNSKFECLKCGYRWWARGGSVIRDNSGCPNCHSSSNETVISDWLTNHNIEYIREYKFNDCKNKQPLPFDFYIPKYGILIEMQGEQHFRPVKFRKTMSDEETIEWFNYRQRLDNIKSSYAKEMGYTFVEIRFDEDIKDRLKKLFNYLL